jgi:hypothetical protein
MTVEKLGSGVFWENIYYAIIPPCFCRMLFLCRLPASVRRVFNGFSAEQVVEVRLKDIRKMQPFAEELLATKITNIQNVRCNHTKADSIQRVVNLLALTDAKKTAEKMCEQMRWAAGWNAVGRR